MVIQGYICSKHTILWPQIVEQMCKVTIVTENT